MWFCAQGALLVKSVPPANIDAGVDNMFSSLIPDSAAKALSRCVVLVFCMCASLCCVTHEHMPPRVTAALTGACLSCWIVA